MKATKEILEDELENYEEELKGLSSFLQELKTTTTKLATDPVQYEQDQIEAEQNMKFYDGEIAKIEKELGESPKPAPPKSRPGSILPQTKQQGIASVIFSSIGFVIGAFFGSRRKSRQQDKDSN